MKLFIIIILIWWVFTEIISRLMKRHNKPIYFYTSGTTYDARQNEDYWRTTQSADCWSRMYSQNIKSIQEKGKR